MSGWTSCEQRVGETVSSSVRQGESGSLSGTHLVVDLVVALGPPLVEALLDGLDDPPPEDLLPGCTAALLVLLLLVVLEQVVDEPLLGGRERELARGRERRCREEGRGRGREGGVVAQQERELVVHPDAGGAHSAGAGRVAWTSESPSRRRRPPPASRPAALPLSHTAMSAQKRVRLDTDGTSSRRDDQDASPEAGREREQLALVGADEGPTGVSPPLWS